MDFAGKRYYNINRLQLIAIGLWPYDVPSRAKTMFCYSVYALSIILQLTPILTRNCNFEYIVKQFSYSLPCVGYSSMYSIFYFNIDAFKGLLEQIKLDWNTMERNSEIKILKKYACYSHLISLILFYIIIIAAIILLIIVYTPLVLDFVVPLNESRPRKQIMELELFIDEDRYYHVYLVQQIVLLSTIGFTLITTGSMLLAFLTHCCATYKIASNLLENLVTEEMNKIPACQRLCMMHRNISRAVRIHKTSMLFLKNLLIAMNKWFFIIMVVGVLSLSCNLLHLFIALTISRDKFEIFLGICMVMGHVIVMFVANIIGQLIIDHSGDIFHAAYRTMWYMGPLSIQKLLLFTMQRSLKPDTLLIGGLFVASLEGFSTLATSSMSYFTVFCNIN